MVKMYLLHKFQADIWYRH